MDQSDIYRYSERGKVDLAVRAMQERIVEELRAVRTRLPFEGLDTQAPDGSGTYRRRMGRTQAWQEAWAVTADHYRNEYMRIEREVTAHWGIDA